MYLLTLVLICLLIADKEEETLITFFLSPDNKEFRAFTVHNFPKLELQSKVNDQYNAT